MIEAILVKVMLVVQALLAVGKVPLLWAGKAAFLLLAIAVGFALLVTMWVVGLAVGLSLVLGEPSSRARPTPNSR